MAVKTFDTNGCYWTPSDTINSSETSWMIEFTVTEILELMRKRAQLL